MSHSVARNACAVNYGIVLQDPSGCLQRCELGLYWYIMDGDEEEGNIVFGDNNS